MSASVELTERIMETYLSGKTLKMMLFTASSTTPTSDQHDRVSDVVADEASGTGYARQTLSSVTSAGSLADHRTEVTAGDVTFANYGPDDPIVAVGFMEFDTDDATSPYLGAIDVSGVLVSTRTPTGGDFIVRIGSDGFLWVETEEA